MMNVSQEILSQIVIWAKYAKFIPEINRRENWDELCDRNMAMHIRKYPMLKEEIKYVYNNFVRTKKVLPSMRSLQFGGTPIELNNARIFNCSFVAVDDPAAFWEAFFLGLSGVGVGYSVQKHHVDKLPIVQGPIKKSRRYLIADSIEGWADAVRMLVRAYFDGRSDPVFDYRDIRPKGTPLKSSGGKAPGPDPLRICLDKMRAIFNNAIGRKLSTIEVHDIMCTASDAILAGGIRRSALISLFDHDDLDMLSAKSGAWWELHPERGRCNNSVVLERGKIDKDQFLSIWKRVKDSGSGEPGFFWTNNKDLGTNPCCLSGESKVRVITSNMNQPEEIALKKVVDLYQDNNEVYIQTLNLDTNEVVYNKITAAQLSRPNAKTLKIITTNGKTIITTPDHKFYTKNRGWIEAQDLQLEDILVNSDLESDSIDTLVVGPIEDTYDVTVENTHSFFADDILVHNCEISLNSAQFCNLTIINAGSIESQEDLNARAKAAAFIGTLQAGYTDFHYLRPQWKETTEKEALLGVSMTGIAAGEIFKYNLEEAADETMNENERVAEIIGINKAARITAIKPEGTTSLVLGTSSGVHAWHDKYYIRRMRVGKNEALYDYMVKNFPDNIEDCQFKPHLEAVMSFPQKAPEGAITRDESALEFLERVKKLNIEWVHKGHRYGDNYHNVSCTASIRDNEWEEVGEWLWENRDNYTGISVLPYDNGTYVQAPFESCDEETYNRMMGQLHGINIDDVKEDDDHTSHNEIAACAGGQCEVNF